MFPHTQAFQPRTQHFGSPSRNAPRALRKGLKWNDIGALKRALDDMLLIERNRILRETVRGVKEQRRDGQHQ